jgi:FecR protein
MRKLHRFIELLALFAFLFTASAGQAFAITAGVFQFVAGDVRVALAEGSARPATKGSPVSVGDTITTAKASMAQIKMGDGAIIVVQPESTLTVAEFRYSGKEDGTEKILFRLEQGGFRSVTGAIGHTNKGNYMIETPIAHIGVRGTDHESWYFPSSASFDGTQAEAGLYNRVNVGLTYIRTSSGEVAIGPNQVGYASTAMDRPHLLDSMPEFFNRSVQPRSAQSGAPQGQGAGSVAAQGSSGKPTGAGGTSAGTSGSLAGYTAPRGKGGAGFGETAVNPAVAPNGAKLANAGGDSTLGVNWGTWQGGLATVNGRATTGGTHFIDTNNLTTITQLAVLPPQMVSGTYQYVGGAPPTNGAGVSGVVNSLSVGINMTTQTVTSYSLNATVGAANWNASGSGSLSQFLGTSGISLDGKCSGCTPGAGAPTAHGTATGAFVGGQAGGLMTSFGLKAANQTISGVGLLSR